jgi:cholesterol transport system auxiliary component
MLGRVCMVTVAAIALAGCVSLGGKAPKQLIGLTPLSMAAAGANASGKLADALVVIDPVADRRLDVPRVAVQVDDTTVAYLKDVSWVERPARQFRHLLAETLRARGGRLVLEAGDEAPKARQTLSGRLVDMGYDARSRSVVVRFDAMREDGNGMLTTQRFESVVRGIAPEARAVAPALNRAANDVARAVADWVG